MADNLFSVENGFSTSIQNYVSREQARGKDTLKTLSRLMLYWCLNAMRYTPKATPEAIEDYLMANLTTAKTPRRKRSKVVNEMRNTRALLIVLRQNWKGAKFAKGDAPYRLAKKFLQERKFASNYHRGGFVQAIRGLSTRKAATERTPRYAKGPTGYAVEDSTGNEIAVLAVNMAKVIGTIAPEAFEMGGAELYARMGRILQEDRIRDFQRSGLNAK